MADYLTLTEFVPGTKAKAEEVNANFSTLRDAVNKKAALTGDSTQTFNVANATQDAHAANKGQLDILSNDLTAKVNKTGTKFCVKSGYTTNGKGDLFSYEGLKITPKIGGTYGKLTIIDHEGTQTLISTAVEMSMSGKPNGTYNIFITPSGTLYTLSNTIYRQSARPTMYSGDIWLNTNVEPFDCIKYDGTSDVKFLDLPLGKVTVKDGVITAISTFGFNQNGHNVTTQTTLEIGTNLAKSITNISMPNYFNPTSKSFSTVYQSASDGYLFIQSAFGATFYVSAENADTDTNYTWTTLPLSNFNDQGYIASTMLPIAKGVYYKVAPTRSSGTSLIFYPCLGV